MSEVGQPFAASWDRAGSHMAAAMAYLDLDAPAVVEAREYIERHNELELAFDALVDHADDLNLPVEFWQELDKAAREMRLYSAALRRPHLTSADFCRRHLAAASER